MSTTIQADGTFRFDNVPCPGTYVLKYSRVRVTHVTSTTKLLGSVIAEKQTLRGHSALSTRVEVQSDDLTGVKLVAAHQAATLQR